MIKKIDVNVFILTTIISYPYSFYLQVSDMPESICQANYVTAGVVAIPVSLATGLTAGFLTPLLSRIFI